MGWKFSWASSFGSDFNFDFGVPFTEDDLASGKAVYNFAPKGRDEDGLAFTMSWLRHHDRYDDTYALDAERLYVAPARLKPGEKAASCCEGHG